MPDPDQEKPPCTCKVTARTVTWDDRCRYHGKDGTMIALLRETRELRESAETVDREVPRELDRQRSVFTARVCRECHSPVSFHERGSIGSGYFVCPQHGERLPSQHTIIDLIPAPDAAVFIEGRKP